MASALLFVYAFVAVLATGNALRPPSPGTSRFPPLWLPAMVTSELAELWIGVRLLVGVGTVALGALDLPIGRWGAGLLVVSLAGQLVVLARHRRAATEVAGHSPLPSDLAGRPRVLGRPRRPETVELVPEIPYHQDLTLDLYRLRRPSAPSPVFLYVHGGGWTGGEPHKQGRTTFHHLAAGGWAVATIRYPLSPAATFPDHLVAVKRAVSWVRTQAGTWGFDPERIVLAGGSAGGHLAALAALTTGRRDLQPGFEEMDCSVAACVPMYGVYDFFNRNRTRFDWPVIPRHVMKATADEAPERYRDASPLDQVHPDAPPFLVVHGTFDSLVPPAEGRQFYEALATRAGGTEWLPVPFAQHAFDAVDSRRTRAVAFRIATHLDRVLDR